MIQVPDLCIGNWVYDGERTRFPMFIRAIGEDYIYLDFEGNEGDLWESKPEELEGIPLTEELLEKMGFYRNELWWRMHEEGYVIDISVGLAYVQIEKWADGRIHSRCTCHGVRFVHELQNTFRCVVRRDFLLNNIF